MNKIDELVVRARHEYNAEALFPTIRGERKAIDDAIDNYRKGLPPDQFNLEFLASDMWWHSQINEATGSLRAVVLKLAEKL